MLDIVRYKWYYSEVLLRQSAQIAQSVEQGTENPCVAGSIPALGICHVIDITMGQAITYMEH